MLASTVQFSTYDQTPPTRPRRTHPPRRADGGTRSRTALTEISSTRSPGAARSLRTQQRAYDRRSPHRPAFHAPPEVTPYWEPTDSRPAELVSVPPSSTTPDARGHPRWTDRSRPGRGSGPPPTREAASAP